MLESIDGGTLDTATLRSKLEANEANLHALQRFLLRWLSTWPLTERPTPASAKAAKQVFGTVELCEQILLYLRPRDVISAIQINHDTLSIFKDSSKLHYKLSVYPTKNSSLDSPFWKDPHEERAKIEEEEEELTEFSNFEVKYSYWSVNISNDFSPKMQHRVVISAEFDAFGSLPKVGQLCRRMLISQPIIRVMQ